MEPAKPTQGFYGDHINLPLFVRASIENPLTCPSGYVNVVDEDTCKNQANFYLTNKTGVAPDFQNNRNDRPLGCFVWDPNGWKVERWIHFNVNLHPSNPAAGAQVVCQLNTVCEPAMGCNVCDGCCHDYIGTGKHCLECVEEMCPPPPPPPESFECDPKKGCTVCSKCCQTYITDGEKCMKCVEEECNP